MTSKCSNALTRICIPYFYRVIKRSICDMTRQCSVCNYVCDVRFGWNDCKTIFLACYRCFYCRDMFVQVHVCIQTPRPDSLIFRCDYNPLTCFEARVFNCTRMSTHGAQAIAIVHILYPYCVIVWSTCQLSCIVRVSALTTNERVRMTLKYIFQLKMIYYVFVCYARLFFYDNVNETYFKRFCREYDFYFEKVCVLLRGMHCILLRSSVKIK